MNEPLFAALDRATVTSTTVRRARELIQANGLATLVDGWRTIDREATAKRPGGRPAIYSTETTLTLMVIAAIQGHSIGIASLANLVANGLTDEARAELHLPPTGGGYDALWRGVQRILEPVNAFPAPRKQRTARIEDTERDRTDPKFITKFERLTVLGNQILALSWALMPREHRRHWRGDIAIDATFVKAFGRPPRASRTSEPDAGWYQRTYDNPQDDINAYGWEAHIATLRDDRLDGARYPLLTLAMTFDRPSHRVAENAMLLLLSMHHDDHPKGVAVTDRAYWPGSAIEKLQLPARALGWKNANKYRKDQLGHQTSHAGAIQVDGHWYCPSMPKDLVDASQQREAGTIDDPTWYARVAERDRYLLKAKERPDADGHQVLRCPAIGSSATAHCPLRPESRPTNLRTAKRIPIANPPSDPDRICAQSSVSFPPTVGAKYRQDIRYGTEEWERAVNSRNVVEAFNAHVKNGQGTGLSDPSRRRLRGQTAQHLSVALLVFASNVRKIDAFEVNPRHTGRARPKPGRRRYRESLREYLPMPGSGPPIAA